MAEGYDPPKPWHPFLYAALTGSFGGTVLMLMVALSDGMPTPFLAIPIATFIFGILTLPAVAIALLVFGLPLTFILRPALRTAWSAPLALLLGMVCGHGALFIATRSFIWGREDWWRIAWGDPGPVYGAVTGLAWWFFFRRWHLARHAADMLDVTPARP